MGNDNDKAPGPDVGKLLERAQRKLDETAALRKHLRSAIRKGKIVSLIDGVLVQTIAKQCKLPDGSIVPDRLVTVEEAAELLGDPERTIRNWINREYDKLDPVDKLGGPKRVAARYCLSDILARRPLRD